MNIFALIYLDEDISNLVTRLLRSRGMGVKTVQECQMLGKSDPEQLSYADSVNRMRSPFSKATSFIIKSSQTNRPITNDSNYH